MKLCRILFLILININLCKAQDQKARECLFKMLDAISHLTTARYNLFLHERIGSIYRDSEFEVKLSSKPFKLYALSKQPNPGAEALFIDGFNNQKILINPNRFPYINISLSISSSLLRKNHHYTMTDIGFSYIEKLLKGYIRHDSASFYKTLRFYPGIEYLGRTYLMLEMDYPNYSYVDYKVQADENITSIANKLLVNDYKILSLNPGISYYDDVKPGQMIKVPNAFARRIVLYIDKESFLPLVQSVYDEKGLFGRYEMRNFKLNPLFDPAEFTSKYKGYRF